MFFYLVMLGVYMGWVESVHSDKGASIPDSGGADPPKSVSGKQTSAPPDIPELYLRPELIPIEEPDGAAVEEAERVLRR